jgi:glycosyltransferase involved in cell wall biosynthesis
MVLIEVGSTIRDESTGSLRFIGTGPLPAEGVRQVFRVADLMVYPARADNFPYVILEALACGTPVLATRVGGIPEELIEGEDGMLFMPGNLPEAMGYLTKFLNDPTKQELMRKSARLHAVRAFDLGRMAADYERLYAGATAEG